MYLTLEHLTKTFPGRAREGEVTAVDDVSLDIAQGEFVTLLGPSGCGKTTTLRLIAGFESPTRGRIMLDGQCLNELVFHLRQDTFGTATDLPLAHLAFDGLVRWIEDGIDSGKRGQQTCKLFV